MSDIFYGPWPEPYIFEDAGGLMAVSTSCARGSRHTHAARMTQYLLSSPLTPCNC
jgi:hypothetical protein